MKQTIDLGVKFLAALAATLMILAALAPVAGSGRSPYLSALADWAGGRPAQAAQGCENKVCNSSLTRCVHLNGSNTNCGVGDFCRQAPCP